MYELSKDLLRISRKAQMCVGKIVKKYNITIAEESFFMAVNFHDGATQEELTSIVGVDKAMTTRVIHSLEKKGFVKRIPDLEDKRQKRIYKTEKAKQISEDFIKELMQLNQTFIQDIDSDNFACFKQTLIILENNISGFLKSGDTK